MHLDFVLLDQLTCEQRKKIIGLLMDMIQSWTNTNYAILAPVLEQRHMISEEEVDEFTSSRLSTAEKQQKLVSILIKIATMPQRCCIRYLYLSLMDSFEKRICRETELHFYVAHNVQRQGQYRTVVLTIII